MIAIPRPGTRERPALDVQPTNGPAGNSYFGKRKWRITSCPCWPGHAD